MEASPTDAGGEFGKGAEEADGDATAPRAAVAGGAETEAMPPPPPLFGAVTAAEEPPARAAPLTDGGTGTGDAETAATGNEPDCWAAGPAG